MAEGSGTEKPILNMVRKTQPDGRVVFVWDREPAKKPEPTGYDSSGKPVYSVHEPTTDKKA